MTIGAVGPRPPLPGAGGVRGGVTGDKYATLAEIARPHWCFDMALADATAQALKRLRSLTGGTAVLRWPTATGLTFVIASAFNDTQVMRLASPGFAIWLDRPIPESFSYMTFRSLPAAEKTTLETSPTAVQRYFWVQYHQPSNTSSARLNLFRSGTSTGLQFAPAAGDTLQALWNGSAPVAGLEPTADVMEMWGARFDAASRISRIYHVDAEAEIAGALHTLTTPYDDNNVIYMSSFGPGSSTAGWVGDIALDVMFDDTDPRRACSDQQYADVAGEIAAALTA